MAEIVLFHHTCGLTDGVRSFAEVLREAGHTVLTPDLFGGRTFTDVHDGVAYAQTLREELLAARAAEIVSAMPHDLVYGGMSMGAARAAEQVIGRPGARGAFFLYGAIAPSWWQAAWPAGVRSQAHVGEVDAFREPEAEREYVAEVPNAQLFVYPGSGHLFAEAGHPDHDEKAARRATERVLAFLAPL
ncbi:dienelactone hydrolase family protein [Nocardioides sp. CER19]|uniref:dienelactone hydrolase family protein n=1 Tax=Nocardioides sp. CER19 TaxID=3038538 RepID=UPI002446D217|nr:dienelactone hydrolase family protein [Nocardioides sp. CER19]MDH2415829.1 dienelactone hydrolase family protein [Nocardioides sp. CER19]